MDLNSTFTSIKTDVDLSEVPPLNRRRLVAFVSYFLMKNTEILNSFAARAEDLLLHAEKQLRVTDKRLRLLEEKLLEIQVNSTNAPAPATEVTTEAAIIDIPVPPGPSKDVKTDIVQVTVSTTEVEISQNDNSVILVKDEPTLSKYFKMLKVGIAEQAVKIKMSSEGFDPLLLDTPNAPCPPALLSPVLENTPVIEELPSNEEETIEEEFDSDDDSISSFSD